MNLGGIEINCFVQVRLKLEAKFENFLYRPYKILQSYINMEHTVAIIS